MFLIKQHITKRLDNLIKDSDNGFDDIFDLLNDPYKAHYKPFLVYIDKVINDLLKESIEITYTNLHLEGVTENCARILKEFVIAKFFHLSAILSAESDFVAKKVNECDRILRFRYKEVPSYVSGIRSNKKAKKWEEGKIKAEKLLRFYQSISQKYGTSFSFSPCTIVSLLRKDRDALQQIFETRPFAISIEDVNKSTAPVLLNSELPWDKIDGMKLSGERYLFDEIENVIIIGSEGKKVSRSFTHRDLKEWNQLGKLKNILVVSFSKEKDGFYKLKTKLDRIQSTYHSTPKYPDYNAYPILKEEIDHLLKANNSAKGTLEFFGDEYSSFWEEFILLTKLYEGLYELRSYKLMNIYSIVTNDELKDIILDSIFAEHSLVNVLLITEETRDNLHALSAGTVKKIREALDLALTYIIKSGWREYLLVKLNMRCVLVLPELVKGTPKLLVAFKNSLRLTVGYEIHSWYSVDLVHEKNKIVVLDYRDAGRFPYMIKPNILELPTLGAEIECYFIKMFFKLKFEWSRYRYSVDLVKILRHEIRIRHFDIDGLSCEISNFKPNSFENTNWDFESQYEANRTGVSVRVRFDSNRIRSFTPSELFIVRLGLSPNLFIARIGELLDEGYDEDIYAQVLDEIHSGFNIYEKIANNDRETRELRIIKEKYSVDESEKPEHLWKLLLKRRAAGKDLDDLYNEVQSYLKTRDADLVSKGTFENHWLNVDSMTLIPREKRSFYFLCEYLGLPVSYFTIMVRLKNVEVQNTRHNSRQMNSLLSDLIDAGCFDENVTTADKILRALKDHLQSVHDLTGIGFYTDTLVEDLNALVELLKPHIQLAKIEDIEFN